MVHGGVNSASVGSYSLLATRGGAWTVEKAAVRWSRVNVSVVPATPIGKATNSTLPRCFLRTATRREYFSVFSVSLMYVATEVFTEADLDDNNGAFVFEGGRVKREGVRKLSRVY